jgi:hypothetical protein
MSASNRDPHDDRSQEEPIEALKRRVEKIAGGAITTGESDTLSAEQRRQFWQHVVDWETARSTTDFQRLTNRGMELPEPESLDDDRLAAKLWEVIDGLADLGVFLNWTDHLSDRELYAALWRDLLRQEVPMLPDDQAGAWHVDVVGSGTDEADHLYLKYYADEEVRQQWRVDFPDFQMPEHETPPFDRDRRLPKS